MIIRHQGNHPCNARVCLGDKWVIVDANAKKHMYTFFIKSLKRKEYLRFGLFEYHSAFMNFLVALTFLYQQLFLWHKDQPSVWYMGVFYNLFLMTLKINYGIIPLKPIHGSRGDKDGCPCRVNHFRHRSGTRLNAAMSTQNFGHNWCQDLVIPSPTGYML